MEPTDLHFDQIPLAVNPDGRTGISSQHTGGTLVAFVDDSVQFLQDSLPGETTKALLLRNDGQPVKLD